MNLSVLKQLESELVEVDIYLVEPPKEKDKEANANKGINQLKQN